MCSCLPDYSGKVIAVALWVMLCTFRFMFSNNMNNKLSYLYLMAVVSMVTDGYLRKTQQLQVVFAFIDQGKEILTPNIHSIEIRCGTGIHKVP